jgi:thiol:disulfide interchange protein DsbD
VRAFIAGLLLSLAAGAAHAQEEAPRPKHVEARLIAEEAAIVPGGTVTVGLRQIMEPGWHTYWANPGDAGEPTRLDWALPEGYLAGPLFWPTPARLPVGNLMNFGYENRVTLITTIAAPKDLKPGTVVELKGQASWLVCSDICVPEEAAVSVSLPVIAAGPAPADPIFAADFQMARASLPHAFDGKAQFSASGGALHLMLLGGALPSGITDAAFFPLSPGVIRYAAPQRFSAETGALALTLAAGSAFTKAGAHPPAILPGVVALKTAEGPIAFTIAAEPAAPAPPLMSAPLGVPLALVFAVLGGLILNLMPCVFPVLSMKALVLARQAEHDAAAPRLQGIAYGVGVVLSFLAIGGLLLALRQAGIGLGWGFQFQSPLVVALMALLFLGIALNLAGLFEVNGLQNLGGAGDTHGTAGAFLTGVLAVVVASPCTAPFMAAALGAALTASPFVALAIFAGLGIGMAAPLVLIGEVPALIRLLPKPGAWMARLKLILALPMLATALWLAYVLERETGARGAGLLALAGTGLALAARMTGKFQRDRRGGYGIAAGGIIALLCALLIAQSPLVSPSPGSSAAGNGPIAEPYSTARLDALRAAGRPVFVDLTAAWCITCQLNEAFALSDATVADAFRAQGVIYLKGDWTNGNPDISALLAEYGRDGVPLSLFFAGHAARAQILPQILTPAIVREALAAAPALPPP